MKVLERKQEIDIETAKEKAKTTPILVAGKEGFFLKSADGDYQLIPLPLGFGHFQPKYKHKESRI